MKIHILGPGCAKCTQLAETVTIAAKELGIDYELEKVTDFNQIISFGVMIDSRSGGQRRGQERGQGPEP